MTNLYLISQNENGIIKTHNVFTSYFEVANYVYNISKMDDDELFDIEDNRVLAKLDSNTEGYNKMLAKLLIEYVNGV